MARLPPRVRARLRRYLNSHFDRSEAIALAAEAKALRYLVQKERQYLDIVADLRMRGYTDADDALGQAMIEVNTTRAEVDTILARQSDAWARSIVPPSYLQARLQTATTLHEMAGVSANVRLKEIMYRNFRFDSEVDLLITGTRARSREAFLSWNQDTADWLGDTFIQAADDGIPIGNYKDIGTDRDTLVNRLAKAPGRLRGRIIQTKRGPRHYPAELEALHLARIEQVRIENDAAEIEAERIGLTWCYNANPDDKATTPVCRAATRAGVMPKEEMIEKHGKPPRLDKMYHLCRSKLIYVDPEWVD